MFNPQKSGHSHTCRPYNAKSVAPLLQVQSYKTILRKPRETARKLSDLLCSQQPKATKAEWLPLVQSCLTIFPICFSLK